MTNHSKVLGKIEIIIDKNLPPDILYKIDGVVSYLRKNNIEAILQESSLENGLKIIIKILSIGDISDKQMKKVFEIMFSNTKDDSNFCKLIDRDKEFLLPDDVGECLDWFIIE